VNLAKANVKDPNAWPADVLNRIRDQEGKPFTSEQELLLWTRSAGLNEKQTAALLAGVPDHVRRPANVLFCLDLADGRILWKRELPLPAGAKLDWGGHSTPAVAGDLVVALGWDGTLFACAKDTGELRWSNSVPRSLAARGLKKLKGGQSRFLAVAGRRVGRRAGRCVGGVRSQRWFATLAS